MSNKSIAIIAGIAIILAIGSFALKDNKANIQSVDNKSQPTVALADTKDLVIAKSEVTEIAKFYPYEVGGQKAEVVAVKASDGTVRTAFNTCQVCFDSGRGYYVQEGDELVCQNCGNRFQIDQVEKIKGGCNPVPILSENKTEDATNITISKDFLAQNKDLFANWKTR